MQDQKSHKSVLFSFVVIIVVVLLVIYLLMRSTENKVDPLDGIGESSSQQVEANPGDTKQTLKEESNNTKPMESNKKLLQNFTPVTGVATLEKKDLKVGDGKEVPAGATVSVHYTGAVAATGEIFQSSKDFGTDPITFPLSQVIKGWTDGIPGMKVGGTRRLVIPAAQAYGANPPGGSGIPANADLVFDVELIAVK